MVGNFQGVLVQEAGRALLNAEEQEAMDDLLNFMRKINAMGMTANRTELVAAIHVLQGFVVQHMLHRLEPERWSAWTGDKT